MGTILKPSLERLRNCYTERRGFIMSNASQNGKKISDFILILSFVTYRVLS